MHGSSLILLHHIFVSCKWIDFICVNYFPEKRINFWGIRLRLIWFQPPWKETAHLRGMWGLQKSGNFISKCSYKPAIAPIAWKHPLSYPPRAPHNHFIGIRYSSSTTYKSLCTYVLIVQQKWALQFLFVNWSSYFLLPYWETTNVDDSDDAPYIQRSVLTWKPLQRPFRSLF